MSVQTRKVPKEIEKKLKKEIASSGNRTRAARVAGEHSTTEPTMLENKYVKIIQLCFYLLKLAYSCSNL